MWACPSKTQVGIREAVAEWDSALEKDEKHWSTGEWNQHPREKESWVFWHKWPDSPLIYTGPGPLASRWYICEACELNSFLVKAFRLNHIFFQAISIYMSYGTFF